MGVCVAIHVVKQILAQFWLTKAIQGVVIAQNGDYTSMYFFSADIGGQDLGFRNILDV